MAKRGRNRTGWPELESLWVWTGLALRPLRLIGLVLCRYLAQRGAANQKQADTGLLLLAQRAAKAALTQVTTSDQSRCFRNIRTLQVSRWSKALGSAPSSFSGVLVGGSCCCCSVGWWVRGVCPASGLCRQLIGCCDSSMLKVNTRQCRGTKGRGRCKAEISSTQNQMSTD